MNYIKNHLYLMSIAFALIVLSSSCYAQDNRSIELMNNSSSEMLVIIGGKKCTVVEGGSSLLGQSTLIGYAQKMFLIQCPTAGTNVDYSNSIKLDLSTLLWLAKVYEHAHGLDQLILNNSTLYPAEITDLNDTLVSCPITIVPGEAFAKNAAYFTEEKAKDIKKMGKILITILAENIAFIYPQRVYQNGAAHTMDFRSSAIDIATLFACKQLGITITELPKTKMGGMTQIKKSKLT